MVNVFDVVGLRVEAHHVGVGVREAGVGFYYGDVLVRFLAVVRLGEEEHATLLDWCFGVVVIVAWF